MALGGDILIKLAADVAELRTGMNDAKKELSGFSAKFDEFGKKIGGIAAGLFAGFTVGAVAEFAKASAEVIGDLGEISEALGLTTEQFQAFKDIGARSGVEELDKLFIKFNKTIGQAADGNKQAIDAFANLGVKLLDAKGKLLPTGQVAEEAAKKILAIEDPAKRASAAAELFGKSGPKMLAALHEIADGSEKAIASLRGRGGIASDETISKLDAFFDSFKSIGLIAQNQAGTTFANLLPDQKVVDNFIRSFEQLLKSIESLSRNPAFTSGDGGLFKFLQDSIDETTAIVKFINDLPKLWDIATNQMAEDWLAFDLKFNEITLDARKTVSGWISDFVNFWIEGINKLLSAINDLPDKVKKFLGLTDVPLINKVKIEFDNTELEARIKQAQAGIAALQQDTARKKIDLQAGSPDAPPPVTSADFGKPTGVANPVDKGTAEKIQKMLDELVARQKAEEKALQTLREEGGNKALRDLDRAIETQKKIDEAVGKAKAEFPGFDTSKIAAQIEATERAAFATKDYRQALGDAVEIQAKYGDGMSTLKDQLQKIEDAHATGKLSADAYAAAIQDAKDAQELQALKARGQVEGLDAVSAGFEYAAKQFEKSNNSFATGGKIFTGVVDLMSNALDELVTTGEINFGRLLLSFSKMITQMALQAAASQVFKQFLQPALGGALSFLGGGSGGFVPTDLGTFPGGGARASGGNVRPGVEYTVGEFGREKFIPAIAGQIQPIDETVGAGMRQVFQSINISTPDANSFRRSRRQVARQARQLSGQDA